MEMMFAYGMNGQHNVMELRITGHNVDECTDVPLRKENNKNHCRIFNDWSFEYKPRNILILLQSRARMSLACHDLDFDPAMESHQMALTLSVFVPAIRKSQT